ncbi:MAG: sce7726 family protein [Patescibacteria group bacterium]
MLSINKNQHTSDLKIRHNLIKYIGKQYNNHPAKIIEEFSVCDGAARVDLAAVNGIMHGFEIKSDIDSLNRLPHQIELYGSVFDRVTLVVGATHLYEAFNMIPEWWGVLVARINKNGTVSFNEIRSPKKNRNVKIHSVVKLLWKEEAISVLEGIGFARGYKSKNREQICRKITEELDLKTISTKVRESILFNRQGWKVGV